MESQPQSTEFMINPENFHHTCQLITHLQPFTSEDRKCR